MHAKITASVFALSMLAARAASAQEPAPPPPAPEPSTARVEVGMRQAFIANPGYDAFSKHNEMGQLSVALSQVVFARGRFSVAPGLAWDFGSTEADVRGSPSSLVVHRLSVPIEARYRLLPSLYAYARVAPGAVHLDASVNDASAPGTLTRTVWIPSADASAGASFRLFTLAEVRARPLDVWIAAEGGYGWTRETPLTLSPDLPDGDPRRTGSVDLGAIALRGGFVRAAVAMTF